MSQEKVLLKEYGDYAEKVTRSIKDHVEKIAETTGRPLIYLNSSKMPIFKEIGAISHVMHYERN